MTDFEVLMEHLENVFEPENCTQSLVLSQEAKSHKAIPFCEVNWRRWILRLNSYDAAFNFGRWFETVSAHFDEVIDLCEELDIYTQSAVHVATRLRYESLSELTLEHEDCTPKHRSMLKELEDKWRRNLVRSVSYTNVKEGHLSFDSVSLNQAELVGLPQFINTLSYFCYHTRIDLHRNDLLATLQQLDSQITRSWSNFENNICRFNSALFNDLLNNFGVLQNVLAKALIESKVIAVSSSLLLLSLR
jgi:hypothetical protein